MTLAVSLRPLTPDDQVRSQVCPCGTLQTKWHCDSFYSDYFGFPLLEFIRFYHQRYTETLTTTALHDTVCNIQASHAPIMWGAAITSMYHPVTPRLLLSVLSSCLEQITYRSAATCLSDVTLLCLMLNCFFCLMHTSQKTHPMTMKTMFDS